jgi:hypothetical protein
MRFLRRQTLNRRVPNDNRLYIDTSGGIVMGTTNSLQLPSGTGNSAYGDGTAQNQRPVNKHAGMIRYNETTADVEVYQGGTWRALRYKESTGITQQTLGFGDNNTTHFGPLSPAPPATTESGSTWGGQNILVVVENVLQIFNSNYTVVQNPTIPGEIYTPKTAGSTTVGSTTINLDPTLIGYIVYPSVSITGAIVTGTNIQANTAISSYTVNAAGQLTQMVLNKPTVTGTISAGTVLTITDATNVGSGWFLNFSSPVPYGKAIVVLHGFDR